MNWRACDRSGGWLAADYARALLAELPPGAQLLSGDDLAIYPLCTLRFTEGVRPDVGLVNPIQLDGDADLLKAMRAKRHGTAPPQSVRAAYSPDPTSDFEGLARDRCGLVYRLRLPDDPPQPPPPFAAPEIRGMRDDEADPFARSVVARIEADLADAAAVRGDDGQMRDRLERVVRIAPPRPWGNMQGAQTLIARVERRAQEGGIAAELHDPELRAPADRRGAADRRSRDPSVRAVYLILSRTTPKGAPARTSDPTSASSTSRHRRPPRRGGDPRERGGGAAPEGGGRGRAHAARAVVPREAGLRDAGADAEGTAAGDAEVTRRARPHALNPSSAGCTSRRACRPCAPRRSTGGRTPCRPPRPFRSRSRPSRDCT